MSSPSKSVYLSCVAAEFQSYLEELAHNLTRRGFTVKSRGDFRDDRVLEQVEDFIRRCDVVVCLAGDQFGPEPSPDEAAAFADIAKGRHSYAQWEYLFGARVGKAVYAFVPSSDAARDSANTEPGELSELQERFRRTWIDSGVNGEAVEFSDMVSLRVEALVLKELTPEVVDPQIARTLNPENPYAGLKKYTEKDAHRFFGRHALTDAILKQLTGAGLLTVYGKSGAGKSSLLRAGVIPRFLAEVKGSRAIVFNPDTDPFASYAQALARAGCAEEVVELARHPSPDVFHETHRLAGGNETWLIFIDQFEEIFTRPLKKDAPQVFLFVRSLIAASVLPTPSPLRLVLAIRDDFVSRLTEYEGLAQAADKATARVPSPRWEQLCEIIEMPAALHGVRFEPHLVSRIVSHVEGEAQNLPALQYTLYRLWEVEKSDRNQFSGEDPADEGQARVGGLQDRRINRSSYKALNGVPNALVTRLSQLFGEKSRSERDQLRRILLCFVSIARTEGGYVPVTQAARIEDLNTAGGPGCSDLIDLLVSEGLICQADNGKFELTHESLLLKWKDLSEWAQQIRDAMEMKEFLHVDAKKWQARAAENAVGHEDLWGGARLERARELDTLSSEGVSAFDRVGGLGILEKEFLTACGDRFVKEAHYHFKESAREWFKSGKSREKLLRGAALHRAMELSVPEKGEIDSPFDRVGGLDKLETKFLEASVKNSQPRPVILIAALVAAAALALGSALTSWDEQIIESVTARLFPKNPG